MNNDILYDIIKSTAEEIEGQSGNWKFVINSVMFFCITDKFHNRMRIIAPINSMDNISNDQINRCMKANFHTALDARYCISDNHLWAAFIHPLEELSREQVKSALSQVFSCVATFGKQYSSGHLIFPTDEDRKSMDN